MHSLSNSDNLIYLNSKHPSSDACKDMINAFNLEYYVSFAPFFDF